MRSFTNVFQGFTENSSLKVHLQRIASLIERIPTWKLRNSRTKNVLFVTKKICKNISQVSKITFKQIVSMLHNTWTICLKVILRTWGMARWGFPNTVPIRTLHTSSHFVPVIFSAAYPASQSVLFQEVISTASFLLL